MNKKIKGKIGSVETAFKIIEVINQRDGIGVTELAETLQLPKSTVYSHLKTLHDQRLIVKENRKYFTGFRFLQIGERRKRQLHVRNVAYPELEKLAEETGEVVNLMIEEFGDGVYLDVIRGSEAIALDAFPGKRDELHCTAAGKAILAHLPVEKRERVIESSLTKHTENTITDEDELRDELETIRKSGIAFDREEKSHGLRCVSCPILQDNVIRGSISISGPLPRMQGRRFEEEIPELVKNSAGMIGINMTYST